MNFPMNPEAEQALLGAILSDNRAFDHVAEFLTGEHFYHPAHGAIFEHCRKLIESGKSASPVTMKTFFERDPDLEEVGGGDYLGNLAGATSPLLNAKQAGKAIHDLWVRREGIQAARDLEEALQSPAIEKPAIDCLQEHDAALQRIAEGDSSNPVLTAAQAASEAIIHIEKVAMHKGGVMGLSTGLVDLDAQTGGLFPGQVVVLAGRPGMGKTALGEQIGTGCADRGEPVAFFSVEMTARQVTERALGKYAEVEPDRLTRPGEIGKRELERLGEAEAWFAKLPFFIDDSPAATVSQIHARARGIKRRHGLKLVVIDHLGYLRPVDPKAGRTQQLGDMTKACNRLAKELNCAVLLLAQLNRGVEGREDKRPMLADLRDSGTIEEDAHSVWLLYREAYYLERNQPRRTSTESKEKFDDRVMDWEDRLQATRSMAEVIVAKQRHGPIGTRKLHWNAPLMKFGNYAHG